MSSNGHLARKLGIWLRVSIFIVTLLTVESLVFAVAALPGIFTFRWILSISEPRVENFLEPALIGLAFVPGYFVFCLALMAATAAFTKVLNWRSSPGSFRIKDYSWGMLRWSAYNCTIHAVRIFAGGLLRSTPIWSWFVRLNGAKVGHRVHINTLGIYDHNLLTFGDDVVVGSDAKLSAHIGEGGSVYLAPVTLGARATIGADTVVHPGVVIGEDTVVGAMSMVPKDAILEPRSVYGGVPVRLIRTEREPSDGARQDQVEEPVRRITPGS